MIVRYGALSVSVDRRARLFIEWCSGRSKWQIVLLSPPGNSISGPIFEDEDSDIVVDLLSDIISELEDREAEFDVDEWVEKWSFNPPLDLWDDEDCEDGL